MINAAIEDIIRCIIIVGLILLLFSSIRIDRVSLELIIVIL